MPGARRDAVPVLPGGGGRGFGGGRGARVGGDAAPDKAHAARGVALPLRHDAVGVLDHQEQLDPVVLHLEVRLAPGHRGDHAVALIAGVRQRVTLLLQIRAEPVECLPGSIDAQLQPAVIDARFFCTGADAQACAVAGRVHRLRLRDRREKGFRVRRPVEHAFADFVPAWRSIPLLRGIPCNSFPGAPHAEKNFSGAQNFFVQWVDRCG